MRQAAQLARETTPTHAARPAGHTRTHRLASAHETYSGNQAALRRLSRTNPRIQCRLTIGSVNDPLEGEADRVADQVMRMPAPALSAANESPVVRRKCAACEEEDKNVQVKSDAQSAAGGDAPPMVHDVLSTPGQPLDAATRAFFEPRFGADFGGVRVHTDSRASESARTIHARAYAYDRHVVFADGQYSLPTEGGRRLLAHELAHVVHQGGEGEAGRTQRIERQPDGGAGTAGTPVYACTKDLETSPIGKHAFFRVGGAQSGNPTYELEPQDNRTLSKADGEKFHSGCWQGVPMRDVPEDVNADAACTLTTITLPCLEQEFSSYPLGKYCTFGPNSNSFVFYIAKKCGVPALSLKGWTPGDDVSPPTAGTFAPSPGNTALNGCSEESGCLVVADSGDGGAVAPNRNDQQAVT